MIIRKLNNLLENEEPDTLARKWASTTRQSPPVDSETMYTAKFFRKRELTEEKHSGKSEAGKESPWELLPH